MPSRPKSTPEASAHDRQWLRCAARAAVKSPHPTVKVGAALVTPDGAHLLGSGANSPPDGIALTPERLEHGAKSLWFMCAEKKALAAAQERRGRYGLKSLKGCGIYSTLMPCHTCAHDLIQAGIGWVCIPAQAGRNYPKLKQKYRRSMAAAAAMLAEKGVQVLEVKAVRRGKK